MFCSRCGYQVENGSAFCPSCGNKIEGGNPTPGAQASYGSQPQYGSQNPYGGQPQYGAQNPYGSQPQYGAQNPYGSQPQYGAQNPYGSQPQYGAQNPYGGQSQYGGQYAQQPQKKSKKTLFIVLGSVLGGLILIAALFFLLRGCGGSKAEGIAKYKGTWTCVSCNSAYVENRYEYIDVATVTIDGDKVTYDGNFNVHEMSVDEFEYLCDSGVNMVDGTEFYNDATDQFLEFESYDYYVNRKQGFGLAIGKLKGGDMAIVELEDWFNEDPKEWTYSFTYQQK